ncbi:hypothetical protein B0H17DRAFT_1046958 [Mycena rosella]|uniref:Uncharacterized protein n=1 Tax=Mycena rosella TaxID=1033263 RepID=A0AAD7DYI7_MYCRO|nr:hypothetical protein B0H17DRAFT_1046958 [Mycena rosella]
MHILSTINAKTQSSDDVPVVLVTLDGRSKFLPRPETHKEMQRLVRAHYEIDPHAALRFEVSTWDVCAGQNVEVTEAAYALLSPFLDSVAVVVVPGRARAMPTPSATPPLHGDDGSEDEQSVREQLEPEDSQGRVAESPPRRGLKLEPEDEGLQGTYDEDDAASTQDRDKDHDEADRTRPGESQVQHVQAKEEARRSTPKERGEPSRANRTDGAAESSQAADDDRFQVFVSVPGPDDKECAFMTRGRHRVRKVLEGVCKTFKLDPARAKLMLCVSMEDDDGEETIHHFECANEETLALSGVKAHSHLVVRIVEEEEADDDDEDGY